MASCKASYGSYCCVAWCTNNGRTRKKPGTHFFRIPRDHRSTAWVTYTRRTDLMEKPVNLLYTSYKICSDHFTAQDFMDPGHTRLTKMAVPTVNPGYVHPVTEGQAGECVVQEDKKRFIVTASCVAEGNLPGYVAPVSELDPADSQMDISGSSSTGAEFCAVHDDASEVSPSSSSFLASEFSPSTSSFLASEVSPSASSFLASEVSPSMSPSASSFLDSASSSVGGFPVACNTAAKGSPSKKFRRTIRRLQSKVASCQRTISRLRKNQRKLPPSISKALGIIQPHVTEEVYKLLCTHMRLQQRGKGKRFPVWLKKFALHLNFRGPRAYRFLAPIFSLPTQRSLRRWLRNIRMSPGVIPGIIQCVSASTRDWNARDRVCTLIFD
ncbi:uncharacterized protein [Dermacentor albipictus]|uniref:uncharacterized protein n=1 Tax=Dermacentor albipictus TaxID=60249 RepID=UPI0038FCA6D3